MPHDSNLTDQLIAALIDHVAKDHYPSSTMMDQIERLLTPRWRGRYVHVLLKKIADDPYPSTDMTRRLAAVVR